MQDLVSGSKSILDQVIMIVLLCFVMEDKRQERDSLLGSVEMLTNTFPAMARPWDADCDVFGFLHVAFY